MAKGPEPVQRESYGNSQAKGKDASRIRRPMSLRDQYLQGRGVDYEANAAYEPEAL